MKKFNYSKSPGKSHTGVILEMFNPVSNSDIMILENTEISGHPKLKFKTRLQTLEERNGNGRYYDKSIGKEITETLQVKAKGRKLFMEVDHPWVPASKDDEMSARKRAVTIELKNCGAILNNIYVDGNDIMGEAETMAGFLGPDLYKTIVYDKADIGFSLRMFGRVQMEESTGLNRVMRPIRPITYDIVTNPSHSTATIVEFVTEDISSFLTSPNIDSSLLQESCLCVDGICLPEMNEDVYDYLDRVINSTFKTIGPVRFRL
jgi:hypothetical protein